MRSSQELLGQPFVSAHADLKQEIAYRQAQQEWTQIFFKVIERY